MMRELDRRNFLRVASIGSMGALAQATCVAAESEKPSRSTSATPRFNVRVCNPLLRTPLSLIIDDSCPVINKAYFWIQQRHDWRMRHKPDSPPSGWEIHYDKLDKMPNAIPAAFAAQWGEWCGEQGIRGKFS
ncbi:hypothetical protein FJY63_06125, partial [Candidatus Sumerlaeota bacterium]|nr:hypothetical protein [Candidatus Sumerlaeota bacterium]